MFPLQVVGGGWVSFGGFEIHFQVRPFDIILRVMGDAKSQLFKWEASREGSG